MAGNFEELRGQGGWSKVSNKEGQELIWPEIQVGLGGYWKDLSFELEDLRSYRNVKQSRGAIRFEFY